ncbi:TM2 domain-containing protein [Robertkochia solimangrovi]|uniref:TM2 domain-containing protein n=1 Tax=Robertkochia solimangrovi TaxID=2213046 RepID=UPI00117F3F38|nr:TM2 domain-containing protein [Robertkochia solimangrovi]TRZ43955.1 hypothetical protein DMZ48_08325 [Robertkochia solimangrovi]
MNEEEESFSEKAKKFADDAEKEFKQTAKDFSEGAKEAFNRDNSQRILIGVLAIVLGALGVHKFVLGYTKEGIILLAVTLVLSPFTCGAGAGLAGVIGLIEGIIYLTMSDEEFYNTYQVGRKPWF